MTLAPGPQFPERSPTFYERSMAFNGRRRGALRFQEGVLSDPDINRDFGVGQSQGYVTPPGAPNHNAKVDTKWPQETMQERLHMGSASWIDAPDVLAEFVQGAHAGMFAPHYEVARMNGLRQQRPNPTRVSD